jgi:hypothetical protein
MSFVYFLRSGASGPIKIGFTGNTPMARLSALQTGNPEPLRLLAAIPGVREDEQRLHERFAHIRIGGEWFRAEPDLLAFIDGALMGCREQPKSYDDMFAWEEWYDALAEYTSLWQSVRRVEALDMADHCAVGYDAFLDANDVYELRSHLDVLRAARNDDSRGYHLVGADDVDRAIDDAEAILARQVVGHGLTAAQLGQISALIEVKHWGDNCHRLSMALGDIQRAITPEGADCLAPVPLPLGRDMRKRVSAQWITGVDIVGAFDSDPERPMYRVAYLALYGGPPDKFVRDYLQELLALLRGSDCSPPDELVPSWMKDSTAEMH